MPREVVICSSEATPSMVAGNDAAAAPLHHLNHQAEEESTGVRPRNRIGATVLYCIVLNIDNNDNNNKTQHQSSKLPIKKYPC